jgi:hypothetical protein
MAELIQPIEHNGGRLFELPPNLGQFPLPHVATFSGLVDTVARVYRPSDEALAHSWENARYMRNDPTVMECLEHRQRSTALLPWYVEPEDPDVDQQRELAQKIERLLNRIPRFMQYRENLLHALWYGRYAVAHRWRWKTIDGRDHLVVDGWYPINGDKLVFGWDDTAGCERVGIRVNPAIPEGTLVAGRWAVERIRQGIEYTSVGTAYFLRPWERPLLAVHKHYIEDAPYETPEQAGTRHGVGLRSRIYWIWYQKQETLAFLMEFLERSAFGFEIWFYPWGDPEARERARRAALERIGEHRNVVLVPRPVGPDAPAYDYQRIEPSMAGAEAAKEIILGYFGSLIKRYILGQTLTSEAANTGLGSNLGEIHLATFKQIIRYDAANLEETLTTDLVRPLVAYNWPQYARVAFRFRIRTEDPNIQEKLETWQKAFEMGLPLRAQDVRDLIGATAPAESDEVLQSPSVPSLSSGMGGQPPETVGYARAALTRYGLPPGLPRNPRPGQTARIGDKTYIFDPETHRWRLWDQPASRPSEPPRPEVPSAEPPAQAAPARPLQSPLPRVDFQASSPKRFVRFRDQLPKDRLAFLSRYTAQEIAAKIEKGARIYQTADGTAGYMLVPLEGRPGQYDLGNVFRLEHGVPGAGGAAVAKAISQGATTLDCIGPQLAKLYARFGFKVWKVDAWDDQYAPPDWDYEQHGRPNIYYMYYAGETRDEEEIRRRYETRFYPELYPQQYPAGYSGKPIP